MDQRQIDEVLERNNIVDIIGSYFPLKKTGSSYKARCPFHDEKTASFVVSEKKQIFKCFGCGKGGNAIHFVQEYEKISFFEALKKLAEKAGIVMQQTAFTKQKSSKRDLIYKIYELAGHFFEDNLYNHGDFALDYLKKRNISENTIRKFQIGFALDSFNALRNALIKNSINEQIIPQTGLFTSNGRDLFRQRLMFPIHDHSGKIIAFGGRILLEGQEGGKYVNSPTTEIYTKGNELYGLFLTKYEIQKKDFVLICEGYTDFLRLFESGFTNSVASLGTSLTDGQINLLSRFTHNYYIVYDGDKAGRKAAVRAAGNVIKAGHKAHLVDLPENDDPDTFLMNNETDDFQALIDTAKTLPNFLFEDKSLIMDEREKLDTFIDILTEMNDQIAKELLVREISEVFKISVQAISSRIRKKRNPTGSTNRNPNSGMALDKFGDEKNIIREILNNIISYKKVAQELDSSYFFSDVYSKIFKLLQEHLEDMAQVSALIDLTDDIVVQNTIAELIMSDAPNVAVEELINDLKLRKYQKELKNINSRILENPQDMELTSKKKELKKMILTLNKKIVRNTLY
ncbi:MAG: DNA primase [Candidatus Cloacimonadales bacterium]|nr:DNA primase [Candidatus Cloacimonadales bacterium]